MGAEQAQMLTGHNQNKNESCGPGWAQGWRAQLGHFQFQEQ